MVIYKLRNVNVKSMHSNTSLSRLLSPPNTLFYTSPEPHISYRYFNIKIPHIIDSLDAVYTGTITSFAYNSVNYLKSNDDYYIMFKFPHTFDKISYYIRKKKRLTPLNKFFGYTIHCYKNINNPNLELICYRVYTANVNLYYDTSYITNIFDENLLYIFWNGGPHFMTQNIKMLYPECSVEASRDFFYSAEAFKYIPHTMFIPV